jgi:two-component system sensor kinase FixL
MSTLATRLPELEALLDAAVDAVILIDGAGRIEGFNRSAERLFGHAAADVLGHNVNLLMTDSDRRQHDAYMERYERTGVPHIIGIGREVQNRHKDGSVFPGFLSVGRIANVDPPRYVGFIHDLTLRHQALAAVVRERDRANRYLEAAQTILIALDAGHRVTLINRQGCEILGCEENALLGLDWFEFAVPADEREAALRQFESFIAARSQTPAYGEYPVRTRSGERRLIAWRFVSVEGADGEVTGILYSGDDVTERRRAEAEARESRERMMHVSRLATMGEMATGISHELNQPLAAITTYAQAGRRLLAAGGATEDVGEALEQIAAQALRAGEIIRRLRSLVRSGESQREPTQINGVIEELGTLTRADARMNDVSVTLDLAAQLPPLVLDRIQIQQVLLNLVRNAVQALEATAGRHREIRIETALNGQRQVEVRVRDNGPGVPVEFVPKLFMPFATTKSDGTGLGLAISRGIIEAHRGTLTYMDNSPRGACFVFRLPATEEPST